jgi:TonB family protein
LIAQALGALANPDAHPPRVRTLAWLAWASLLSVGMHAMALSALNAVPLRFDDTFRLSLQVRVAVPASSPATDGGATPRNPSEPAPVPRAIEPAPQTAAAPDGASIPHRYFTSREVDEPAVPLERPQLVYPEEPYIWRLGGRVRLRVLISADGGVDAVEVVSAEPPGHFEAAALAATRAMRYEPARIGNQPVRSQKLIEVTFDPHEHLRRPAVQSEGRR